MTPGEVVGRADDGLTKLAWRRYQVYPGDPPPTPAISGIPTFRGLLPTTLELDPEARASLLESAEKALAGSWPVFGRTWDSSSPDWFTDPRTQLRAPDRRYAFSINHRDEALVGNIKYVWEPSRHHQTTTLATAYYLTGEERFAAAALAQVRSWCEQNPFLSGIHWTSAIEVGIRLVSFTWTRRLLQSFAGIEAHFEQNPLFQSQLAGHCAYLHRLHSRGSSANNHLVVEMAGLYIASSAFPFLHESESYRAKAKRILERELSRQTFPDGMNRELATSYHGFSTEFFLLAMLEGDVHGDRFGAASWATLCSSFDALAAMLDVRLQPPRQGDDDEAHSLLCDGSDFDRWQSLLATGGCLFGAEGWWPKPERADLRTSLLLALDGRLARGGRLARPQDRPLLRDSGVGILRGDNNGAEIWCRFDYGPHGYTTIAAHAHADALSIEVRIDGYPLLVDPGTYSYHGDPVWRSRLRSTLAHNTLAVDGLDQSVSGGPFLWTTHAHTEPLEVGPTRISARHDGYSRLDPPVTHTRTVSVSDRITIEDAVEGRGSQAIALSFHFGPGVDVELDTAVARLLWEGGQAELRLPSVLRWTASKGGDPEAGGWWSPTFDQLEPIWTLRGLGEVGATPLLITELIFNPDHGRKGKR